MIMNLVYTAFTVVVIVVVLRWMGGTVMKQALLSLFVVGFALMSTGCQNNKGAESYVPHFP